MSLAQIFWLTIRIFLGFIENKDEEGFVMNMKKGQDFIFGEHGENV